PLPRAGALPHAPGEPDQDRVAALEEEALGVHLLRGPRRPHRHPARGPCRRRAAEFLSQSQDSRLLPQGPLAVNVAIVGVGLIGGSLALDLRAAGTARRLVGADANAANLEQAVELGIVDEVAPLEGALASA